MDLLKYLTNSRYRFMVNAAHGMYKTMSDEEYLMRMFEARMGKKLDLEKSATYNEKLQWLKLFDRRSEYITMVDKYSVKKYVADRIGEQYIIPTLGVWERFEEIDFNSLPDQFVLKCTHDSGGLAICKSKKAFDLEKARKKIEKSLKRNYYFQGREWPYKDVKPRIIAEQYMEDSKTSELRDYKFFCFNGVVRLLFIASDRQNASSETKFDFFDSDFQHLDVRNGHPNAEELPQKPSQFELMKELAEKLSQGIPQLRVDFYEVNGAVYFGEMTFFHWSGFVPFDPPEWDETFGSWIKLPSVQAPLKKDV